VDRRREEKISIVRIITRLNIGGPAIHTILLTEGIDKDIFKTHLVAGKPDASEGNMSDLARHSKIDVEYVPELGRKISAKDILAFLKILKILNKTKPDILHTHTAKAGTLGRIAGILTGVPVKVHTFHGHIFDGYFSSVKSRIFTAIEKFLAIFTDRVVVVSDSVRDEIVNRRKIASADKCVVIKLGFDLGRFLDNDRLKGVLRRELNIEADTLLVGIVGRLVPIKNHVMFLKSARKVIESMPDRKLKFVIVGDGELRRDLEKEVRGMALENDIIFTGWITDVAKVYADLDVVVLTSLNEGTPVSLIEAMASARPVIATAVGGVPDIVINGDNGLLVSSNDAEGFSAGLISLLKDRKKREDLGAAGREFARNNFQKERLINEVEDLYIDCLKRKRVMKKTGESEKT